MLKLVRGIHQFQNHVFNDNRELFDRLSKGQQPLALLITCSDSRICPDMLMQTRPGELFVLRTAGNIVPPYGAVHGGEAATIEYAIAALKVRDIIVCGHSHCGAMAALFQYQELNKLPAVKSYLKHAEATRRIIGENYQDVTDPTQRLNLTIEENVLVQLENLRTHPAVAAAVGREELNLHGWVYQFENGRVLSYSPSDEQFMPLEQLSPDSAASEPSIA